MSQHDDHPPDAPDPHDELLSPGDSPAEAPDPFLELERMFGDLAGPPALDPPAPSAPPSPVPRIEPARLEIPPLLEEDALPGAPASAETTGAVAELVSSPEEPVEQVQDSAEAVAATLDWGPTEEESADAEADEAVTAKPAILEPGSPSTEASSDGAVVEAPEEDAVTNSKSAT